MAVSVLSAAKRLGETSDWTLTNLHMQKMCYIAHMFHLGNEGSPLVKGRFQAWEYGPVHPELYQKLKKFGPYPVTSAPFLLQPSMPEGHSGNKYLDSNVKQLDLHRLVSITHWQKGAWAKNYDPEMRNIVISNDDIIEEFGSSVFLYGRSADGCGEACGGACVAVERGEGEPLQAVRQAIGRDIPAVVEESLEVAVAAVGGLDVARSGDDPPGPLVQGDGAFEGIGDLGGTDRLDLPRHGGPEPVGREQHGHMPAGPAAKFGLAAAPPGEAPGDPLPFETSKQTRPVGLAEGEPPVLLVKPFQRRARPPR